MSATQRPGPLSMTGFGRAERRAVDLLCRVEVRSVNARGLKVTLRTPPLLEPHQAALETAVTRRCGRGTVTAFVTLDREQERAPARLDEAVLAQYLRQIAAVRASLPGHETAPPDAATLVRLPGVIVEHDESDLTDAELAHVLQTLDAALDDLLAMRTAEGEALERTLRDLLDRLAAQAVVVSARVPTAISEHQLRMRERLDALLDGAHPVPDELLAREIAVLVEKTDVAEELARLESHVAQARAALSAGEPCGRRLEFLAQEMSREANTIGAKSSDLAIRDAGVEMRLLVDRLKEQAANVE